MKKAKRDVRHETRGKASRVSRLASPAILSRARRVFDVEIEGLKRTRASIGPSFTAAVRLLYDTTAAGGIVVVTGVGKNLHAAEKISAIFASTGTRSIVLNPVQAMHGDLGMVSQGDVLLALSFSGESEEVLKLIPAVRRHGLKVVSMTGSDASTLAVQSDVHLAIPCGKEACPFGMAPTSSVTATLAMGDALAMVLIDMHKFSIRDYAENHPAGAIGRALLLTVADVMRTGDRLAVVSPSATVMDTLMAMTKAQQASWDLHRRRLPPADGQRGALGTFGSRQPTAGWRVSAGECRYTIFFNLPLHDALARLRSCRLSGLGTAQGVREPPHRRSPGVRRQGPLRRPGGHTGPAEDEGDLKKEEVR